MNKKAVRVPDDGELVGIAAAACESAASKLKAATLLLGAGQWAEAFYNAALGFEELGKAHLCMTMVMIPVQYRSEVSPREFSELFNGQAAKAAFGHLVLRSLVDQDAPAAATDMLAEAEAAATQTNGTKFRGLYVDLGTDGTLLHPKDVVEADARWMVDRLQTLNDWMSPMCIELGQDPDFLAFLQQFRENIDADALVAAVDADPDLWLQQLRGAVRAPGASQPSWIADALPPLP
ncbi:AbiV family abortive infection protein [Streptomyces sp. MBT62]|uniref:AbiV family abortive infection protein n=1 Tax=Streptomyces sp. MBT62 TaxID=2800410 RepID=UPI00190BD0E1|nr:AbiV family abortive infection protein [Streptomyces sp. MBT62]MBK3571679.1 AbiV family abortive infection protein [Streptomyces sp. MBT62]